MITLLLNEASSGGHISLISFNLQGFIGFLFFTLLFITVTTFARIGLHPLTKHIPESSLIIILGIIFGFFVRFTFADDVVQYFYFNPDIFLFILIPPLIYESGYQLERGFFVKNVETILSYAVIGTLLNTFLIGFSIWGVGSLFSFPIHLLDALLFGAMISAVDPVAVLAIFEDVKVNETLNILVFGESVFNDAVSIVLFQVFILLDGSTISAELIFLAILKFILTAIGGLIVGVLFGIFTCWLTKYTEHFDTLEPLIVLTNAMLSFVVAEVFHFSGIVATLFAGMTTASFIPYNISRNSQITLEYILKMLAQLSDTIIFFQLGIVTVLENHLFDSPFVFLTLLFILLYRALSVFGLTNLANRTRIHKVPFIEQLIMILGGLRGAIAFSLAVALPDSMDPETKQAIKTTVLFVVLFTVFIQGSLAKPIIKALKVRTKSELPKSTSTMVLETPLKALSDVVSAIIGKQMSSRFGMFLNDITTQKLLPHITRNPVENQHNLMTKFEEDLHQDALVSLQRGGTLMMDPAAFPDFEHPEGFQAPDDFISPAFRDVELNDPSSDSMDLEMSGLRRRNHTSIDDLAPNPAIATSRETPYLSSSPFPIPETNDSDLVEEPPIEARSTLDILSPFPKPELPVAIEPNENAYTAQEIADIVVGSVVDIDLGQNTAGDRSFGVFTQKDIPIESIGAETGLAPDARPTKRLGLISVFDSSNILQTPQLDTPTSPSPSADVESTSQQDDGDIDDKDTSVSPLSIHSTGSEKLGIRSESPSATVSTDVYNSLSPGIASRSKSTNDLIELSTSYIPPKRPTISISASSTSSKFSPISLEPQNPDSATDPDPTPTLPPTVPVITSTSSDTVKPKSQHQFLARSRSSLSAHSEQSSKLSGSSSRPHHVKRSFTSLGLGLKKKSHESLVSLAAGHTSATETGSGSGSGAGAGTNSLDKTSNSRSRSISNLRTTLTQMAIDGQLGLSNPITSTSSHQSAHSSGLHSPIDSICQTSQKASGVEKFRANAPHAPYLFSLRDVDELKTHHAAEVGGSGHGPWSSPHHPLLSPPGTHSPANSLISKSPDAALLAVLEEGPSGIRKSKTDSITTPPHADVLQEYMGDIPSSEQPLEDPMFIKAVYIGTEHSPSLNVPDLESEISEPPPLRSPPSRGRSPSNSSSSRSHKHRHHHTRDRDKDRGDSRSSESRELSRLDSTHSSTSHGHRHKHRHHSSSGHSGHRHHHSKPKTHGHKHKGSHHHHS